MHKPYVMIIQIAHQSPVPIYEQLFAEIERMIISGDLEENDSLPSIRQLSSQLDVAVNTVARAYQELERRGYIISNGRKGTFVRRFRTENSHSKDFRELIRSMIRQGMERQEIEQLFHNSLDQIFN